MIKAFTLASLLFFVYGCGEVRRLIGKDGLAGSLAPASVNIIFPNGGEKLSRGGTYDISWEENKVTTSCNINLLNPDSSVAQRIAYDAYVSPVKWRVPIGLPVGQYAIEVYCPESGISPSHPLYKKISDLSDGYFLIISQYAKG